MEFPFCAWDMLNSKDKRGLGLMIPRQIKITTRKRFPFYLIIKEAAYTVGDVLSDHLMGNIRADVVRSMDDEGVYPSCPPICKPLII